MLIDLGPLPYRLVTVMLEWCIANNIDIERVRTIVAAIRTAPPPDIEWVLDIPESHMTWIMLKYSSLS